MAGNDEISDAHGNAWVFRDSEPPPGREPQQGREPHQDRYPDRYTARHPSLLKLLRGLEAEFEVEATASKGRRARQLILKREPNRSL